MLLLLTTATARAPWEPGQSVCPKLPGFEARDVYPTRAPLLLADFLIPEVHNLALICKVKAPWVHHLLHKRHPDKMRRLRQGTAGKE